MVQIIGMVYGTMNIYTCSIVICMTIIVSILYIHSKGEYTGMYILLIYLRLHLHAKHRIAFNAIGLALHKSSQSLALLFHYVLYILVHTYILVFNLCLSDDKLYRSYVYHRDSTYEGTIDAENKYTVRYIYSFASRMKP